ncbi:MAG: class I SAM-dependent methyltransferase [Candidatus Methanomethyliaceae archaeon]|nr:class I SAM-dependent methyltransferase [Candidatus Methanomethyliaceae archaeon]MDW7971451.1 class I SAM-dependent methyltransferase [Nitrososphaerota archaeon]
MTILWETGIPQQIYANLYCKWKRVKREVKVLANVFRKYGSKRLIEFGCGLGRHGYLLRKMGFEVLLTDVKDWRYGAAKRMPFIKLDVFNDSFTDRKFDGGYAINFLIIFKYNEIAKVLSKISDIIGNGIFIADYNFTLYNEPLEIITNLNGRTYKAILEKNKISSIDKGNLYEYRIKVIDDQGKIIGIEEASYPIYDKEILFKAIEDSGFRIIDTIWAKWNPDEYVYEFTEKEADSAFIVMSKSQPSQ